MVLSVSGLREDGRRPTEIRRFKCDFKSSGNHDGSATVHMGLTTVSATVQGPREVTRYKEAKHDRAIIRFKVIMAPFSTMERKKRRHGDRKVTALVSLLEETFSGVVQTQLYQNSQIDVTISVLAADGGYTSACINAASLALLDAGVPMLDIVAACSVGFVDNNCIIDLNYNEQNKGADMTVAIMPKSRGIVTMNLSGNARVGKDILELMVENGIKGCSSLAESINLALHERM
mmetsp:Transcript_12442/g.14508  ORF Transcript_12442/g.14508 Transcript_12442/m.14508 type:complete len:233 (-) Transcript_12442:421-1119(-)